MPLNPEQLERYDRQIILSGVGTAGQEKLLQSKVLVIGAGGLGSPAALYLAAAGVGTLGLVDDDAVAVSNLQRQILHFTPDTGRPKIISAQEKINKLNPDVKVNTYSVRAAPDNIADLIAGYDFVIDATDNFTTKFLINDACVRAKKPFSHGGVSEYAGQTLTYLPGTACFRCVFSAPPDESASRSGVLGAAAGTLGTIQAAEALKYLLGIGELLTDRLLIFDALLMSFRTVKIKRNPDCPVCT